MYCGQRSQYIRLNSKKNSFRGNYSRKYGMLLFWFREASQNLYTVFPRIVSAETILFWIWPDVLWPLITVHKSAENIQGRKLFKGGNYSRKYGILLAVNFPMNSQLHMKSFVFCKKNVGMHSRLVLAITVQSLNLLVLQSFSATIKGHLLWRAPRAAAEQASPQVGLILDWVRSPRKKTFLLDFEGLSFHTLDSGEEPALFDLITSKATC